MITLYHAAELETLTLIAAKLLKQPLSSPLHADKIIVPSQGVGRWLTLKIAEKNGLSMHMDIQLPAQYIWSLFQLLLNNPSDQEIFSSDVLTLRIYDWLCNVNNVQASSHLAHYLIDSDDFRRISLAEKIANVFDQYLLYRRDWLKSWEKNQLLNIDENEKWQADLWRSLVAGKEKNRSDLLSDLLDCLSNNNSISHLLPERLIIFGINTLAPDYLSVLEALAHHIDIIMFVVNPCREAWGDIQTLSELASMSTVSLDDWFLDVGHPLLASFGKQGRDFFDQLFALVNEGSHQEFGIYSDGDDLHDDSLLHAIQNDILTLRTRASNDRMQLKDTDHSLEVHICHSPLREVEILRDQLLIRFKEDALLTPDDILVLTPDIELYSPYIDAVFSIDGEKPYIPYSLSDRSFKSQNCLIDSFLALLNLPDSRLTVEEVFCWLEQPSISQCFGINSNDIPLLHKLVNQVSIRWGYDGKHKESYGLPDDDGFTWMQGLDRLLLGSIAPPSIAEVKNNIPLMGDSFPSDSLEGSEAQLIGHLVSFINFLNKWSHQLKKEQTLTEWVKLLNIFIDQLFDTDEAGDDLLLLLQACQLLSRQADLAEVSVLVSITLIKQQLTQILKTQQNTSGFLTGSVTFCSLVPMRSLPFKHICIIGLNAGTVPRTVTASGFDLMSKKRRHGDRNKRLDDRYLLLETLLSARENLYLSYIGRDMQKNNELSPSVFITDLLAVVDITAYRKSGLASDFLLFKHARQPFSEKNFIGGRLSGFSQAWYQSAQQLALPISQDKIFSTSLKENSLKESILQVEPEVLIQYLSNPVSSLVEERLAIKRAFSLNLDENAEPFVLDRNALISIRKIAFDAQEKQWSYAATTNLAAVSGGLPLAPIGPVHWQEQWTNMQEYFIRVQSVCTDDQIIPVWIDTIIEGLHIKGWLGGSTQSGSFNYRFHDLAAWDLTPFAVRHLLLNLANPDTGTPMHSRLLSPQKEWHLLPLTKTRAEEALAPWIKAYIKALSFPLPLFHASYYFAEELFKRRNSDFVDKIDRARKTAHDRWIGSDFSSAEINIGYNKLIFQDQNIINEEFESLATELYLPIFEELDKSEKLK